MTTKAFREAAHKQLSKTHGDPSEASVQVAVKAGYEIGAPWCHIVQGKAIQPTADMPVSRERLDTRRSIARISHRSERVSGPPTIFPEAEKSQRPSIKEVQAHAPQYLSRRQVRGLVQQEAAAKIADLPQTSNNKSKKH